jgi:ATP-dependent DNA helicase RecQ
LIFTLQRDELYRLQEYDADTEKLINVILRSYTGLFTDYVYINEESLEIRSGLNRQRIYDILVMLTQRRVLHYIPRKKTPYIIYTRERQEKNRIQLTREVYEDRKESYATRIKAMVEYATAEEKCRSRMLLRYFGEKNENNCGQCDVCLQKHDTGIKQGEYLQWKERILETLSEAPCPVADIAIRLNAEIERIEPIISFLIAEEIIRMDDGVLYLL